MNKIVNFISPIILAILVILLWYFCVSTWAIPKYILPSPLDVVQIMVKQWKMLLLASSITFVEAFLGFVLGSCLGFLTGVIFVLSKFMKRGLYPYAIGLKTVPLVALAPLLVLWFGTGLLSKIIMASLLCYFPVLVNMVRGLYQVDELSLAYFQSVAATKVQTFFKLRLPTALPYFFTSLKISSTMSVIGAIVAELTGSNNGVGYQVLVASYRLETDWLFAAIIAAALIGLMFFYFVVIIERLMLPWCSTEGLE
jgi:NitT/TauT family transport system permease protein